MSNHPEVQKAINDVFDELMAMNKEELINAIEKHENKELTMAFSELMQEVDDING